MIHVIGDSHVSEFYGKGFSLHHVGPATAYGLANDNSKTQSKAKSLEILESVSKSSPIILSFGEVDCRLHIYGNKNRMEERVDDSVDHLLDFYKKINKMGFNVFLYNVNPGTWEGNVYNIKSFPPLEVRAVIHLLFNTTILERISEGRVIDIYSPLATDDLMLNKQYTDDGVHINKKASELFLFPEVRKIVGGEYE